MKLFLLGILCPRVFLLSGHSFSFSSQRFQPKTLAVHPRRRLRRRPQSSTKNPSAGDSESILVVDAVAGFCSSRAVDSEAVHPRHRLRRRRLAVLNASTKNPSAVDFESILAVDVVASFCSGRAVEPASSIRVPVSALDSATPVAVAVLLPRSELVLEGVVCATSVLPFKSSLLQQKDFSWILSLLDLLWNFPQRFLTRSCHAFLLLV